jgi:hypothetical protein
MSFKAVSWVLENSESTLADRLVELVIAEYAHDDGSNAFPKVKTIANKARISERQVQLSLRALEAAGAIREEGKHRSGVRIYTLVMEGRGEHTSPPGVNIFHPGGEHTAPDPVLDPLNSPVGAESAEQTPSKPRPRDELWDAFESVFGPVYTASERVRRNRACKELRTIGASGDGVRTRYATAKRIWNGLPFTEAALVANWGNLGLANGHTYASLAFVCDRCGIAKPTREALDDHLELVHG